MKKTFIALGIIIVMIFGYLVVLSVIKQNAMQSSADPAVLCSEGTCQIYKTAGGTVENIGVSDNVDVTLKRPRWYGTIYVDTGKDFSIETLYLFEAIKIPMAVNEARFGIWHIIIAILSLFLFVGALVWDIIEFQRNNEGRMMQQWQHTGL